MKKDEDLYLDMVTLETAKNEDKKLCYTILDEGRQFQRQQGFVQWTDDYPNEQTIQIDLDKQNGFLMISEGRKIGYVCIDFDGDDDYNQIEGEWSIDKPYAVVHRMAFARQFQGTGRADAALNAIKTYCCQMGCRYIRVDTDFPNKRMQHILEKNGFKKCGVIFFQGNSRIAYDLAF